MLAAVITLSLLSLALGGGLVWAMKTNRDDRKRGDALADLYRAQQDLTDSVRAERDDLVGKLAATDEQLREAKIRLSETEQQRNEALVIAREQVRQEIRNAPDAVAALNKVLAAAPRDGVRQPPEAKAETSPAKPDPGTGAEAGLQITELR